MEDLQNNPIFFSSFNMYQMKKPNILLISANINLSFCPTQIDPIGPSSGRENNCRRDWYSRKITLNSILQVSWTSYRQ